MPSRTSAPISGLCSADRLPELAWRCVATTTPRTSTGSRERSAQGQATKANYLFPRRHHQRGPGGHHRQTGGRSGKHQPRRAWLHRGFHRAARRLGSRLQCVAHLRASVSVRSRRGFLGDRSRPDLLLFQEWRTGAHAPSSKVGPGDGHGAGNGFRLPQVQVFGDQFRDDWTALRRRSGCSASARAMRAPAFPVIRAG